MTDSALILLNPRAGGGRAGRSWTQIEPLLARYLGDHVVAVTQHAHEVADQLARAHSQNVTRVIGIGGDGTNHALINALVDFNARHAHSPPLIYGSIPLGTGRDWTRSLGMPQDLEASIRWLAQARPQATDIGLLTLDNHPEYFLNSASTGLSGEVLKRVNARPRRPWIYLTTGVEAIIQCPPPPLRVLLDGALWYEGTSYILAVTNGTTFGSGMKIAPHAQFQDGLFDVVLVEGVSRPAILVALWLVYIGKHLHHPNVRFARAARVEVSSPAGLLDVEFDGELTHGRTLTFENKPGLLQILR